MGNYLLCGNIDPQEQIDTRGLLILNKIWYRKELLQPYEAVILNQIYERSILWTSCDLISNDIELILDNDGETLSLDITNMTAAMPLNLAMRQVNKDHEDKNTIVSKEYVIRQLRWLNMTRKIWGGINLEYDKMSTSIEKYTLQCVHDTQECLLGVIVASEILVSENEIGNYLLSGRSLTIEKILIENLLIFFRAKLLKNEVYSVRFRKLDTLCITQLSIWRDICYQFCNSSASTIITNIVRLFEHYARECGAMEVIQQCTMILENFKTNLDRRILMAELNRYIEDQLVNDEDIIKIHRNCSACYLKEDVNLELLVSLSHECVCRKVGSYKTYADPWMKQRMKHEEIANISMKQATAYVIIAGNEHTAREYSSINIKKQYKHSMHPNIDIKVSRVVT